MQYTNSEVLNDLLLMDIQYFPRLYKNGNVSLYFYIVVDGVRCKSPINTKLKIKNNQWSTDAKKVIRRKDAPLFNSKLENIKKEIEEIYFHALSHHKTVSAEKLKRLYLQGNSKPLTIQELNENYLQHKEKILASSSIDTYRSRLAVFESFFGSNQLASEVDKNAMYNYEVFLQEQGHEASYIQKCINVLQQAFKHAYKSSKVLDTEVLLYETNVRIKYSTPEYLTLKQVYDIASFKYPDRDLQKVADLFVIQCCTGFNHVDVIRLNESFFQKKKAIDGYQVEMKRQKTEEKAIIFLSPGTIAHNLLINKYNFKPPILDLNYYNKHLKTVAAFNGISNVTVSSKIARATFGHILLNEKGLPLEAVQVMLGHASIKTTERFYARIKAPRLLKEFEDSDDLKLM